MKLGSRIRKESGMTLVELMVAMVVITTGVVSYFGVYGNINKVIQSSKSKTLAVNLAQEKIEYLKNLSYFRLLTTTTTATDSNFSPSITYDAGYYPSETVIAGGITFQRRVYIRKTYETGGDLAYRAWSDADTGLKEILVYVVWKYGNEWRKVELRNLRDDPDRLTVDATISGDVEAPAGSDLASARVEVLDNTAWYDLTDSGGDYSFSVAAGSYSLRASKLGYFSAYTSRNVASGASVTWDPDLTAMSSGSISGVAFIRDHLLVTQVVGSSVHYATGFDQEWIEVFNPTSWTWTMATSATDDRFIAAYAKRGAAEQLIDYYYYTQNLDPGHYFLFANTTTIHAGGVVRDADAVYEPTNTDYPNIIEINTDPGNDAAGVAVGDPIAMIAFDAVGWKTGGQNPDWYESGPLEQAVGLEQEEQYVRKTSSAGITTGYARMYDTGHNVNDFVIVNPIVYPPRNSTDVETMVSGTPAGGAIVFANDNLASPVVADSSGSFRLLSVATGTWTLTVSSGAKYLDVTTITVDANTISNVGNIGLTTASANGYISGRVTTITGAGINNIKVSATGASSYYTDSAGYYRVSAPTGTVEVIANPSNDNPLYTSGSSITVVSLGQVVSNVNFALPQGGDIRGYVSTNGTDALPGVAISAQLGGAEKASAVSGSDGRFTLFDLSTGSYVVLAYPADGDSISPSTGTLVTVLANQSVFCATFTVANAKGEISGQVQYNGAAIKTGVLVLATTSTITSDPPDMDYTLRSGTAKYYQASSAADGTYEISLPGGFTYNVYGWHTSWSGSAPTTVRKSSTTVPVSAGQPHTVDFSWP